MRVAVADDEEAVRSYLSSILTGAGHSCTTFRTAREVMNALQRDTFDLAIIDWIMPGTDGLEIVQWARATLSPCPPIIMLTGRSDNEDIARALNSGADDYIVKPSAANVILARIDAVLRRSAPQPEPQARTEEFGPYRFDRMTNSVLLGEEEIALTSREFALALLFFRSPNRAFSRAYILETLWHSVPDLPTRTLDMHISRIRSKLRLGPENGYRLQTIFGHGYRLELFDEDGR
ncbi:DNA-binding response regulator [Sphingobium jiangsuense]|uniref:DNA-binding response OmpR family regulator n=1 Tax=Sphingobium jiangsuense TaxID=870476 RepID=A0A7W6FPZ5_9SPHN|nr:response regulator transcription factor [Sphingobium jiangsuense]MBB3926591.1 DNA-binding response OmpR family regulator [Sphingobium jiangsuense]GLT00894.1 DNA-binding response regulator [Sphingobium jiangsuense]